jgi:uncharacterized protein YecT (DUF1311 family)
MRLALLIGLALTTPLSHAADSLQTCLDTAITQDAMNACARRELEKADRELDRIYRELERRYKDDPAFIGRLRTAERAWVAFRNAQFAMKFPHGDELSYYGSVFPMCQGLYLQELTNDRVTMLKEWLKGTEGDDVCSGSLKSSEELGRTKNSISPGFKER